MNQNSQKGNFKREVAALLKQERKNQKIKMRELAEILGITTSVLARFESGNENLSSELIERLAGALGLKPQITFVKKDSEEQEGIKTKG